MRSRVLFLLPPVLGLLAVAMPLRAEQARAPARLERHAAERVAGHGHASGGPTSMGKFEDWQAATHDEGGQTTCYAFVRASPAGSAVPGRGDVVLTVTDRPGTARDAVAVSMGYALAATAAVTMQVDAAKVAFYTDGKRNAFARDGHAAIAAMAHGARAVVHAPGPHGAEVADSFSLRGFSAAYAAVTKSCPART
ncbi:MAG: invasion associated locus B family protein [Janthinobacterium lividum]